MFFLASFDREESNYLPGIVAIIEAKNITRTFGSGQSKTHALGPVSFEIKSGEFVIILGRSGSGKSTLLNLLCGLDTASSGSLFVQGKNLSQLKQKQLASYRSEIGIIFQSYNLLPNLNTVENVLLGAWAGGKKATKEDAEGLLKKVNLEHRIQSNVKNLSGGEKQRVSIARSLIGQPDIVFCDEPTGALDSHNEEVVVDILKQLNQEGKTIVMVTHNQDFIQLADRVLYLEDGVLIEEKSNSKKK